MKDEGEEEALFFSSLLLFDSIVKTDFSGVVGCFTTEGDLSESFSLCSCKFEFLFVFADGVLFFFGEEMFLDDDSFV